MDSFGRAAPESSPPPDTSRIASPHGRQSSACSPSGPNVARYTPGTSSQVSPPRRMFSIIAPHDEVPTGPVFAGVHNVRKPCLAIAELIKTLDRVYTLSESEHTTHGHARRGKVMPGLNIERE